MGQFLRVNGDYNIKAGDGARITLDTGPATSGGSVLVTGDLVVEGETLTVAATDLSVEDNIITVNYYGEDRTGVPAGVVLGYAGIEVDRGSLPRSSLVYDDAAETWLIADNSAPGPFNYDESNLRIRRIYTNSTTDDGDLILIGTGTGVVKVLGTTNYEDQVTHDDDLPNKKYVDDAILNNPTFQIVAPQSEDTRVIISDADITPNDASTPGSLAYLTDQTGFDSNGLSAVTIVVDGTLVSQFYEDKLLVGVNGVNGLIIDGINFEIRTEDSVTDQNIYINTNGTGKLQTGYALQLDRITGEPTYVSGSTLVYAKTPDLGESGVWFVNDDLDTTKRHGELISKRKALVFSMLF